MKAEYGWAGRTLEIDLNCGDVIRRSTKEELVDQFMGGRGMNAKVLFDELSSGVDPLGPDNILILACGPTTGTIANSSARFTLTAKSPLTGIHGDSNIGGHIGPEFKYAGYDQLIIRGCARKPVYLLINDDRVELRDASHLWGLDTWLTERAVKEELGDPRAQILCIGPAGEKLVRFAGIIHNLSRAAGRMGLGAVMGSKKLKAIAIRGSNGVRVAQPKELRRFVRRIEDSMSVDAYYPLFSVYGTLGLMEAAQAYGTILVKNDRLHVLPDIENIGGIAFVEKHALKSLACMGCSLHCGNAYAIKNGPWAGTIAKDVEFAHTSSFGARCYNNDLDSILKANEITDRWGVDPISAGITIAWALECYERGVISAEDTGGIRLEWGNPGAIVEMLEKIVRREGFGDVLAEGSARAAQIVGQGSEEWLSTIKGAEMLEYDPRAAKAWGLAFAVASRGADHLRAQPGLEFSMTPELAQEMFGTRNASDRLSHDGKGRMVCWLENTKAVVDSLEICKFYARTVCLTTDVMAEMFRLVTGIDMSPDDAYTIGERICNVEKSFNVREGMRRKDDSLPKKFSGPITDGPNIGATVDLDRLLDDYYAARGWDRDTSIPTREKLESLGLGKVASDLEAALGIPLPKGAASTVR